MRSSAQAFKEFVANDIANFRTSSMSNTLLGTQVHLYINRAPDVIMGDLRKCLERYKADRKKDIVDRLSPLIAEAEEKYAAYVKAKAAEERSTLTRLGITNTGEKTEIKPDSFCPQSRL